MEASCVHRLEDNIVKMYLISRKAPWSSFIGPAKGRLLPLGWAGLDPGCWLSHLLVLEQNGGLGPMQPLCDSAQCPSTEGSLKMCHRVNSSALKDSPWDMVALACESPISISVLLIPFPAASLWPPLFPGCLLNPRFTPLVTISNSRLLP
jgi:hypothetical protein